MLGKSSFLMIAAAVAMAGCSTQDWRGAVAEKAYDKELDARRLASVLNNDDYYQVYVDNKIYVLSDAKDFTSLLKVGEVPKTVTKIGGGPNGERLIFDVTATESKAMESKVGYRGGAQEMYEGKRPGLEKGFFGVLAKDGNYVVTDEWAVADQFRLGQTPQAGTPGTAPDGKPVSYVSHGDVKELKTRFEALIR